MGGTVHEARNDASASQGESESHTSPRWTRHTRAETTERILDAAEDLFSRRDPDQVSVREIADAAGITHAVVHEYLGTKADIVAAVLARGVPQRRRLMTEHPDFFQVLPLLVHDLVDRRVHSRLVVRAAMDDKRYESLDDDRFRAGRMLLGLAHKASEEGVRRPPAPPPMDPRVVLAATTALAYGWVAMEDWLLQAYELQDADRINLRSQLALIAEQVAGLAFPTERGSR